MSIKPLTEDEIRELKKLRLKSELPHLYGWKWYSWAWKFYNSTNRFNFLCAANQISKSSTQIRKSIDWATDQEKWPRLWIRKPNTFWYFYPTKTVATSEFKDKWVTQFLPRASMRKDPVYGWEEEFRNREIHAIHYKSGITSYFKTYEQDVSHLQTSTVDSIFCDEELPFPYFNELRSRLIATNGYFHMVFTATLGQDEWRRTMEPANKEEELFPDALKIQVSMYDCLKYMDGTPSFWTPERIKEVEMACASETEVQKRVFGRFVLSSGLQYPGFNRKANTIRRHSIPYDWPIYTGIDIGSGGESSHPAAVVFIAVRPDFKYGIIFKCWRGDGVVTTAADILEKYNDMCSYEVPDSNGKLTKQRHFPVLQSYDWQAKDFFTIATRAGIPVTPADKNRDRGINLINTLFKLKMLVIMDEDPETAKLVIELINLKEHTNKANAQDDLIDAMRYSLMPIPWNFDGVAGLLVKQEENTNEPDTRSEAQKAFDERRPGINLPDQDAQTQTVESEFDEWQGYIDGI